MAPSRIVRTEEFYLWDRNTPLTPDELNRRFVDIHLRLQFAETEKLSDETLRQEISDRVLQQSEAVISGLRDQLLALTQLEWLTTKSQTAITLVEGQLRTVYVAEADRDLFTPGPYVVLTREGQPDTYAVARTQTFDRDSGAFEILLVTVVTAMPGPFSDWEIASLAGSTLAQMVLLERGFAARDAAESYRSQSLAHRNAAAASAGLAGDRALQAGQTLTESQAAAAVLLEAAQAEAAALVEAGQQAADIATGARDVAVQKAEEAAQSAEGLIVPGFATVAQIRAGTATDKITSPAQLDEAYAFVDLGDVSGAVTIDCAAGRNFRMRAIGNIILNDFANKKNGWSGVITIRQDAVGSRTIAKNAAIKGPAPTLSTAANAKDRLAAIVEVAEVGITLLETNVGV